MTPVPPNHTLLPAHFVFRDTKPQAEDPTTQKVLEIIILSGKENNYLSEAGAFDWAVNNRKMATVFAPNDGSPVTTIALPSEQILELVQHSIMPVLITMPTTPGKLATVVASPRINIVPLYYAIEYRLTKDEKEVATEIFNNMRMQFRTLASQNLSTEKEKDLQEFYKNYTIRTCFIPTEENYAHAIDMKTELEQKNIKTALAAAADARSEAQYKKTLAGRIRSFFS